MTILNWSIDFPAQAQDAAHGQCRLGKMACSDSIATILGAGYLNQIVNPNNVSQSGLPSQSYFPLPYDQWLISYNGGAGLFNMSISASGVLSLLQAANGFISVPISLSQFLGMYAAPILLVPAAGAGSLIVVDSIELILKYGSAALANGGVVAAQYDSTVDGAGVQATNSEAAADFFVTASNTYLFSRIFGNTVGALPWSTTANKGIYLSNQTAPFITGTGSSFVANVHFHTILGV